MKSRDTNKNTHTDKNIHKTSKYGKICKNMLIFIIIDSKFCYLGKVPEFLAESMFKRRIGRFKKLVTYIFFKKVSPMLLKTCFLERSRRDLSNIFYEIKIGQVRTVICYWIGLMSPDNFLSEQFRYAKSLKTVIL